MKVAWRRQRRHRANEPGCSLRIGRPVSLLAVRTRAVQSGLVASAREVLRMARLRKTFESEVAPVRALRGVDLSIGAGEFVAITGPSGCGKSTLLNLVAGLETPSEGEIFLAGESLHDKGES